MIKTCHEIRAAERKEVLGRSQMKAAAKLLEAKSGIASSTVDRLLFRLDRGDPDNPADRARGGRGGRWAPADVARLLDHLSKADGARLILVGDARRLEPISAGGTPALFIGDLNEERLTTVFRQEEPWARHRSRRSSGGMRRRPSPPISKRAGSTSRPPPEAMDRLVQQWEEDGGVKNPRRS